jgi:hypothetical protein
LRVCGRVANQASYERTLVKVRYCFENMSKKIRPLTLRMGDELQIILGAMELGDYDASLSACARAQEITDAMRAEVMITMGERHQDELQAIESLVPGHSRRKPSNLHKP